MEKEKPKLEGDVITNAKQDYQNGGEVEVSMTMNSRGARIWADMTKEVGEAEQDD